MPRGMSPLPSRTPDYRRLRGFGCLCAPAQLSLIPDPTARTVHYAIQEQPGCLCRQPAILEYTVYLPNYAENKSVWPFFVESN